MEAIHYLPSAGAVVGGPLCGYPLLKHPQTSPVVASATCPECVALLHALAAAAIELAAVLRKVTDQLVVFIRADGSHEPHMNEAVFEAEALLKRIDEGGNHGT